MPEWSMVSSWLMRVLDWPQSVAQLIGPSPDWLLLLLIFVPSLVTVAFRIWHVATPILMLNALVAASTTAWPAGELRILSIALSSALMLALIGEGLRVRRRIQRLRRFKRSSPLPMSV